MMICILGGIAWLLLDCRQVGGTLVLMITSVTNIHSHLHSQVTLFACNIFPLQPPHNPHLLLFALAVLQPQFWFISCHLLNMLWQPCLVCKVETTNYCKICARTSSDGTTEARFYCDTDCSKKDETEHLKVHMTIKPSLPFYMERAVKAGQIVQSLFYAFRENTWTYDMKEVRIMRDQESDLVAIEVTDGAGVVTAPGGYTDCKSYAGGWLIEFPVKPFGPYGDDAKHALLADRSSTWALVVMHTAVQALFQGTSGKPS